MHGDGTKPAILIAKVVRLLDLTRSLRRADRMATGVDRVERAYLAQFLEEDAATYGLVRTALGYLLLDRPGMMAFQDRLQGLVPWGPADILSRLARGRSAGVACAESDLRRLAIARARRGRLPALLAQALPAQYEYFNVGHSNLTDRVFDAIKGTDGHIHVLVHDVIPLTHPQFQRPGTVTSFRAKIERISAWADRVIFNSDDTRCHAEEIMQQMGRVPPGVVAHLGTTMPVPDAAALPPELPTERPYFVVVGTIEPRKNHDFLLDVWEALGADAAPLLICGTRGWNNEALFARLDALPPGGPVKELQNLDDSALAALVQGSAGMLFPSHVEGFGLPPLEAAQLGTRVLCNDLPVLREFLGEKAVYASVSERYLWISKIKSWVETSPAVRKRDVFVGPTWAEHFKTVLRLR